ncbi:MAG TPA: hypothetical protein VIT92_06315 [Burkholderiaceae bacterium]
MSKKLTAMTHRLSAELQRLAFEHRGSCVSCGYRFKEADTSHWGYGAAKEPLYVCDRCADQLTEIARRESFMVRPYQVPAADTVLWRYMDFTKFVSLISTKTIYFPSAASFDDLFEGAKGLRTNKGAWDKHFLEFFRSAVSRVPGEVRSSLSDEQVEKEALRLLKALEAGGELDRKRTFISCWHANEHESEAMWKLYSTSIDNAIAVQTTYRRLYESLGCNPEIQIGAVQYIDLTNDFANINDAFWRKRKSFEHEREVRAVVRKHDGTENGLEVSCDVSQLVQRVVVSPRAPEWFTSLVIDICRVYGFRLAVEHSAMIQEPFF